MYDSEYFLNEPNLWNGTCSEIRDELNGDEILTDTICGDFDGIHISAEAFSNDGAAGVGVDLNHSCGVSSRFATCDDESKDDMLFPTWRFKN